MTDFYLVSSGILSSNLSVTGQNLITLGYLLVGVCMYSHCGDDVIDELIDEASD